MKYRYNLLCLLLCYLVPVVASGRPSIGRFDYDGDGFSDLAVHDTSAGAWFILSGRTDTPLAWNVNWGPANSRILSGDFDGDNKMDLAAYYPANGGWYAESLDAGALLWGGQWGFWRARPVPADYNGDGQTDLAVFHREAGNWYIRDGASENVLAWGLNWGSASMRPVPADYNQDGIADLAVYDENTGNWYIRTLQGQVLGWNVAWGFAGAIPVPGDFDGDGYSDLAVYQPTTGSWYIRTLSGNVLAWAAGWGFNGAVPMPGDYNGDGKDDLAVYHTDTGNWYIRTLEGDVIAWAKNWGYAGAVPLPRSDLAGHVDSQEGPVTGPASLRGEWVGDYYHQTVQTPPTISNVDPVFADVQHRGGSLSILTSLAKVGNHLGGSINGGGDMVLVDRYDGETWTTPYGPASYNSIRIYDFIFRPIPGVVSVLQVIDLVRY